MLTGGSSSHPGYRHPAALKFWGHSAELMKFSGWKLLHGEDAKQFAVG